jgi:hypothetical protein
MIPRWGILVEGLKNISWNEKLLRGTGLKNLLHGTKNLLHGTKKPGPPAFVKLHNQSPKTQPPFVHIDEGGRRFIVVKW